LLSYATLYSCSFFFFQAEDGIRDRNVTGVQTCALPISCKSVFQVLNNSSICQRYRYKDTTSSAGTDIGRFVIKTEMPAISLVFCFVCPDFFCARLWIRLSRCRCSATVGR